MAADTLMEITMSRMLYVQFSRGPRQVVSDLQGVVAGVLCADREVHRVNDHIHPSFLRSLVRHIIFNFFFFLQNYNNFCHYLSNLYQLFALAGLI